MQSPVLEQVTGVAPLADAHGKQRVTAVLSSVETSDLRKHICLPSPDSRIALKHKTKGAALQPPVLEQVTGVGPAEISLGS